MQVFFHTVFNLLPYHILAYGALLGTELFQSFVNTQICCGVLPMCEFVTLQKRLFPAYFQCQVGLVILTAATRPPYSIFSFIEDLWGTVVLVIALVAGTLNWAVFGPRATTAAIDRRSLQEQARSAKSTDILDSSLLRRASREFSVNHAASIHLNAISLIATVCYAFSLASSIVAES
ncbi:hypothetical protein BDV59DRAFT_188352 [Aspergillus ambiguus]|uniref:DUF4149 domain-containing protein n=1 Tax=Aspergillus ambiguus TaxID=176160 RepID=UPI003CCE28B3